MFSTKKYLPRRTFLRGMGVTVALPLLDAMVPAFTATVRTAAVPIRRFGAIYLPHGFIMDQWVPAAAGKGFDFTPIMKPLEPLRDHIVVLSGLDGPGPSSGNHAIAPASFLSGVKPKQTEGNDILAAETLDQVLAKQIGQDAAFPSIEVATEDFSGAVGACETAYSCLYMNTISWSTPTTPLPMEINPRALFERIFGGTGTVQERLARMQQRRSILDSVADSATRLQTGLGARDRTKLSAYLDNVREIERRIQQAERQNAVTVTAPTAPAGVPDDFGEHVRLMFDLLLIAYQADITRVFTFMMARDLHARAYPEIGVAEGHHPLSHHSNVPESISKFTVINTYHTKLFAEFLEKMRATADGDGSLLDHSMVLFGSGMSTGNRHDYVGLPLVVGGGADGRITGGRHLAHPKGTSMANLLLTLGQHAGAHVEQIGRSTTTLDL